MFLSTRGKNDEEVPRELVKFLNFVRADLEDSKKDFSDDYVKSLQESVLSIKRNREMEERFMLLELMLQDERREGRAEGKAEGKAEEVISFLEDLGSVSEELKSRIMEEQNLDTLKHWLKLSARAASIEQFKNEM